MSTSTLRHRIHEIIFEADTPAGKFFDVALLILILISIVVVMLESSTEFNAVYGAAFFYIEWFLTIVFTVEYILRLWVTLHPLRYATSFYGIVDILAILPSYLTLVLPNAQYFLIIRILRLMRVFRIFKLGQYLNEGDQLRRAVIASRNKIAVFLFFVTILVIIIGAFMYLVEGGTNDGFSSIPRAVYWAIVTITTVGYGDITPQTRIGQFVSAVVMILGYAIIAVPTGIVTSEMMQTNKENLSTQVCRYCSREGHAADAVYCKYCGGRLNP